MPIVRKTGETHLSSPDQVRGYVRESVAIADELELSPEDRAVLLPQIMVRLSEKNVQLEQVNIDGLGVLHPMRGA